MFRKCSEALAKLIKALLSVKQDSATKKKRGVLINIGKGADLVNSICMLVGKKKYRWGGI